MGPVSGSSEEAVSPQAERGRAPGPCGGGGRASTKTVTRNRDPMPAPSCGVSRAEIARSSLGSESRRFRWGNSCGASHCRSCLACWDRRRGIFEVSGKRAAGQEIGPGLPLEIHDEGRERHGAPCGRISGEPATASVVVLDSGPEELGARARLSGGVPIPLLGSRPA